MYATPSITQHGGVVHTTLSNKSTASGEPSQFAGNVIGTVGFNL